MLKSKLKFLGASAVSGAAMMLSTTAGAAEIRLGNVDISIDTTVSAGVSYRAADREESFLPEANGGNPDDRPLVNNAQAGAAWAATYAQLGTSTDPAVQVATVYAAMGDGYVNDIGDACNENGSVCSWIAKEGLVTKVNNPNYKDNYDGGLNGDDSRLNFDNGDLQGAVFKATFDVEASLGANLTGFARLSAFYDAALANSNTFERTDLMDGAAQDQMVFDLQVLDAYVAYDGDLAGRPYEIRAGKQVINWGESTFVLGGNSVFSPIDVAAIVRPGSEIKEALLPVEALYGSISITDDIAVEAYVGGWDPFKIPTGGSPFAGSDIVEVGSSANQNIAFISGGPGGGNGRINCAPETGDSHNGFTATADAGTNTIALSNFAKAAYAVNGMTCDGTPAMDFRYGLGSNGDKTPEAERLEGPDTYRFVRSGDYDEEGTNYGLAVRWYAANLNSTEFGLYFQNYTSRLPYVSYWTDTPSLGFETMGRTTDLAGRLLGVGGCGAALVGLGVSEAVSAGTNADLAGFAVNDPHGLFDSEFDTLDGAENVAGNEDLMHAMELVCDNTRQMAQVPGVPGAVYDAALTGEMRPTIVQNMGLFLDYPEDIEVVGFSFATTLAGWGVQGELAYRPEMPLQLDTDSLAIGSLVNNCGLSNYGNGGGAVLAAFGYAQDDGSPWASINDYVSYDSLTTREGLTGCDTTDYQEIHGYFEREVTNWDIGTTATYTRSNPLVSLLGADLMVLLTELAGTWAPEIEHVTTTVADPDAAGDVVTTIVDTLGDDTNLRGQSHCTSGTDLPLGGLFNLDPRAGDLCRPTENAFGGVILLSLQYNNVLGSAWSLSPTMIVQQGLHGRSPKPAGNWTEDQGSASFRLNANYQDVSVGLSYTDYYGDELYNSNLDRDFVAFNVTYGF